MPTHRSVWNATINLALSQTRRFVENPHPAQTALRLFKQIPA